MEPAHFFKALSDDTRLRLLRLIRELDEICVCDLVAALDLSQPKISRHLAQLRQLGLVTDKRCGQWVHYRLADELPPWAARVLDATLPQVAAAWPQDIENTTSCCD
ncbi:metalloregulator ArsR/SmtB family transcription factor [Gallaecimonas sp. GXIMD4217]|uniref:metalloregulator ArsR/SmtB family transcription factor n=1 Tax=Gallaecimonas sp. GXIMD4217 TaxID=3131927 RepID=UPI00311B0BF9